MSNFKLSLWLTAEPDAVYKTRKEWASVSWDNHDADKIHILPNQFRTLYTHEFCQFVNVAGCGIVCCSCLRQPVHRSRRSFCHGIASQGTVTVFFCKLAVTVTMCDGCVKHWEISHLAITIWGNQTSNEIQVVLLENTWYHLARHVKQLCHNESLILFIIATENETKRTGYRE